MENKMNINDLVLEGQLWTHLADLNKQAQRRLQLIISQMQEVGYVTEELKQKKFWHVSELASKLSKPPRSIVTESDLDFIVHKVFKGLGYKKEMPNPKLLNAEEATWIILASYYNSDTTLVGLERLARSVEVLYDDWNTNHAVIKKTLKQG